ncbi:hypothetical protein FRAHR75_550021 [Frankia sp. Hr75.2]|nr:hypothetical protein FRAHR75_550021 [Frankia sp. Hr75.2]SQD95251.1 hypothetical protein FMEAI12_3080005 [Parafrankia sp. Ea1.12]
MPIDFLRIRPDIGVSSYFGLQAVESGPQYRYRLISSSTRPTTAPVPQAPEAGHPQPITYTRWSEPVRTGRSPPGRQYP